jgi:hypothetical protein
LTAHLRRRFQEITIAGKAAIANPDLTPGDNCDGA